MKRNKKNLVLELFIFLLGIIIGFYFGHEEEKEPYCVWTTRDGFIYVVQSPNSYVYSYGRMSDGSYELISILSPDSPVYPNQARSSSKNK